MEVKAQLNYLRIAPRKVRLVANLLKGQEIKKAEFALRHLSKRAALPLLKLLQSAVASAKHDFDLAEDFLKIKSIVVNQGSVLKRYRPRAFGRAALIRKETSHISLILETVEKEAKVTRAVKKEKSKNGPVIREMELEDLKEGLEKRVKVHEERKDTKSKSKPVDFVRRMFRRKAI